ncbi:MAG: DNA-processing protein DprA [Candidatus Omnitrophica bacterium]|nr:DNA-processing protein DprA [Candidatus Omnitrophota bacterium]
MNPKEALLGLNLIPDLTPLKLNLLLKSFSSPCEIFGASLERLEKLGIGRETAQKILSLKENQIKEEIDKAETSGIKIITILDKEYPSLLKNIADPPSLLYVKGRIPQDVFNIAIVGSRDASFYGLATAKNFSAGLARLGFWIISGMARGIDTYAHKGALEAEGRTLAVLGSGFNHIYPQENKSLMKEISEKGGVISEFPMDTPPYKANFPRRNRIISGLSLGVLVVEAKRKSGALITADLALEQGREVFCIPGKIDSASSFGTNSLIQQGAKLALKIEDILEGLGTVPIKNQELSLKKT